MCDTCQSNRCDRCPAEAQTMWANVRLQLMLRLCGHHANEQELALIAQGWELGVDTRARLTPA